MEGRIRWYDPVTQQGRVITSDRQSFPFLRETVKPEFAGGDVVSFQVVIQGVFSRAVNIQLRQSGVAYLDAHQRSLVNEFHRTVAVVCQEPHSNRADQAIHAGRPIHSSSL